MDRPTGTKALDAASLKALAHPLRMDLFRALSEQPATATQLAERFGQNTGTTSWHLRHLAKHGFIEDDPGRGDGRERWWRAAVRGATLDARDDGILDDPASLEAARFYVHDTVRRHWEALQLWVGTAERWSHDWIGASVLSDYEMALTQGELARLQHEVREVIERHRRDRGDDPPPGAVPVRVAFQAFPEGEPR